MAVQLKQLGNVSTVTAGTRVRFTATPTITPGIVIQARASNTGNIYIGDSGVTSTNAAAIMTPGSAIEVSGPDIRGIGEEFDLSDLWLDSAVNGEGITVGYIARKG